MPIRLEVFHPDRVAVAIATGDVTLDEFRDFVIEMVKAGLLHYRKIFDVTLANSTVIGNDQLVAMDNLLRSAGQNAKGRGPVAIVSGRERMDMANTFKVLANPDRPVEVFASIFEARRWVMSLPTNEA
jgi:hypothetical protein